MLIFKKGEIKKEKTCLISLQMYCSETTVSPSQACRFLTFLFISRNMELAN